MLRCSPSSESIATVFEKVSLPELAFSFSSSAADFKKSIEVYVNQSYNIIVRKKRGTSSEKSDRRKAR